MTTGLQTYPKHKVSGIGWLGDIPFDWKIKRNLGLFSERNERVKHFAEEDFELLSITIQKGVVRQLELAEDEQRKDSSNEDKGNYKWVRRGDIAYNKMRMWQGAAGESKHEGIVSPAYIILKPKTGVLPRYFHYFFRTEMFNEIAYQYGYGIADDQHSLRYWQFKALYSPFPPLETQERIADFLDEKTKVLDELVAKKEKLIELLREKRAVLITHAVTKGLNPNVKLKQSGIDWFGDIPVGWCVKPLKFLFSYQAGGIWGEEERFDENDMICIRVADFDFLSFTTHSDEYTRRNLPEIKKSFLLDERSVLLEKSGGGDQSPVGRAIRYVGSEKATCSNFIQKLEINSGFNTEFVVYLLATLYFLGVTRKAIKQTTGIQNLDLGYFFRTPVFYPPTDEQKEIAQYIDTELEKIVDTLEKIESQIEKLKEYRSSLIYHAVTGKIKV